MKIFIFFISVLFFLTFIGCKNSNLSLNNTQNDNQNENQIYFGAFNDKNYIWNEYQFTVNTNSLHKIEN